jgi:tetratricopeptide (TPR) repeat protein
MKMKTILLLVACLSGTLAFAQKSKQRAVTLAQADSLFLAQQWEPAVAAYERLVKKEAATHAQSWGRLGLSYFNLMKWIEAETALMRSLALKPQAPLLPQALSRMARLQGKKNDADATLNYLTQAIDAGYRNLTELDAAKDFDFIRSDARFSTQRERVFLLNYPCMASEQARQFDFWIGEWDAYVRGTEQLAGHSRIERASGGCMILENWTSAGPFDGKSINFVDPVTNKWKQVWVGSGASPNVSEFVNGEYRDGAMRFEFETTDQQGNKLLTHFHFYNENPDQVRQLFRTSTDGGATWTVGYDFTYKRKR